MSEELIDTINAMSQEFDNKGGFVTCEVSIHENLIQEFNTYVKENVKVKLGRWIIMRCNTCIGYHGEGYVHASIERHDMVHEFEISNNFILKV